MTRATLTPTMTTGTIRLRDNNGTGVRTGVVMGCPTPEWLSWSSSPTRSSSLARQRPGGRVAAVADGW